MQQYSYDIFVAGYSFTVVHSIEIVSEPGSRKQSEILAGNNEKLSEFFRKNLCRLHGSIVVPLQSALISSDDRLLDQGDENESQSGSTDGSTDADGSTGNGVEEGHCQGNAGSESLTDKRHEDQAKSVTTARKKKRKKKRPADSDPKVKQLVSYVVSSVHEGIETLREGRATIREAIEQAHKCQMPDGRFLSAETLYNKHLEFSAKSTFYSRFSQLIQCFLAVATRKSDSALQDNQRQARIRVGRFLIRLLNDLDARLPVNKEMVYIVNAALVASKKFSFFGRTMDRLMDWRVDAAVPRISEQLKAEFTGQWQDLDFISVFDPAHLVYADDLNYSNARKKLSLTTHANPNRILPVPPRTDLLTPLPSRFEQRSDTSNLPTQLPFQASGLWNDGTGGQQDTILPNYGYTGEGNGTAGIVNSQLNGVNCGYGYAQQGAPQIQSNFNTQPVDISDLFPEEGIVSNGCHPTLDLSLNQFQEYVNEQHSSG